MIDKNGLDITVIRDRIAAIIQTVELPRIAGFGGFLSNDVAEELSEAIIQELPIWITWDEEEELNGVS